MSKLKLVGGRPITIDEAIELRQTVFGSAASPPRGEWTRTGINYGAASGVRNRNRRTSELNRFPLLPQFPNVTPFSFRSTRTGCGHLETRPAACNRCCRPSSSSILYSIVSLEISLS
uniref:(northern house mosquito) hypothetical protein n=1 Tax=Culex pipiens TaxID=7175 RepID=A0A8D8AJK7_CULPI